MKPKDIRDMSDEQIGLSREDAVKVLFRMRLQAQTEKLDSPSSLRKQRRLIARLATITRERQNAAKG